jgi:subtilisin family serine protease
MIRLLILLIIPSICFALPIRKGEKFRIHIPGEYIIKTDKNKKLKIDVKKNLGPNIFLVKSYYPESLIDQGFSVYPNYEYFGEYKEVVTKPNDIDFIKQFHHQMIETTRAWQITKGSSEIVVAVTDNEFQLDHLDLKNTWWKNDKEIPDNNIDDDGNGYIDDVYGWDFLTGDNNTDADAEFEITHGTHVSGIIAATANNLLGGTGIAPEVKVMPLRWYGEEGRQTSAIIVETYQYSIKMGANIYVLAFRN